MRHTDNIGGLENGRESEPQEDGQRYGVDV